jgi:hypothetical protein
MPIVCARTGAPVDPVDLGSPLREILEALAAAPPPPIALVKAPDPVAPPRMLASWDGPDVVYGACATWPAADVREAAGWGPEQLRGVDRPLTGFMGDDGEMVWFNWEDG